MTLADHCLILLKDLGFHGFNLILATDQVDKFLKAAKQEEVLFVDGEAYYKVPKSAHCPGCGIPVYASGNFHTVLGKTEAWHLACWDKKQAS